MSYALSNYVSGKHKRKRLRKQKEIAERAGQKAPNVAKKMASEKASEVTITVADAQRENRQASKRWKAKARKFAFGLAIGLHAAALVVLAVWFVKKTVLQIDEDKIQTVVVDEQTPQKKRASTARVPQKTTRPKAVEVLMPKGNTVTPNTNINLGPADFTMPFSDLPTDDTMQLTTLSAATLMTEKSRQVKIVSTVPKFEMPKFETTGLTMTMDMGTSLASVDFGMTEDLGLSATDFGDTKQSLSEFLRKVRERIKQFQRFPPNVRNLDAGSSTTVRFTLLRDGTIMNPTVSTSSGSRVLDNAALAAVQNAEPYPPFPESQSGSSIRLELPVVFELAN